MTDMEIWIPEQILIFQKSHHPQIEPLRSSRKLYLVYLQGMIGEDEYNGCTRTVVRFSWSVY